MTADNEVFTQQQAVSTLSDLAKRLPDHDEFVAFLDAGTHGVGWVARMHRHLPASLCKTASAALTLQAACKQWRRCCGTATRGSNCLPSACSRTSLRVRSPASPQRGTGSPRSSRCGVCVCMGMCVRPGADVRIQPACPCVFHSDQRTSASSTTWWRESWSRTQRCATSRATSHAFSSRASR